MACNLRRIANLPIREDYKIALIEFFQKPENQQACEQLNQASDEQIMRLLADMESKIGGEQQSEGVPPMAARPPGLPGSPPQAQGIGSMVQPSVAPGVPPSQLADVPKPMDMPVGGGIARVPPRR